MRERLGVSSIMTGDIDELAPVVERLARAGRLQGLVRRLVRRVLPIQQRFQRKYRVVDSCMQVTRRQTASVRSRIVQSRGTTSSISSRKWGWTRFLGNTAY